MKCNYVSIFYDYNSYSINLKNELVNLINNDTINGDSDICVNSFNQFEFNGTNQDQLDIILNNMLNLYENNMNQEDPVIIYIGYQKTYSVLINKLNIIVSNNLSIKNIHLISSASVETSVANGNKSDKIKFYSLSLKESNINEYSDFLNYYKEILNITSKTNDTTIISWINEYLQFSNNCPLFNHANFTNCNISNITEITDSQFLRYSMYSIFGFYEIFKVTSLTTCLSNSNIDECKTLQEDSSLKNLIEHLRNGYFNFQYYGLMWIEMRVITKYLTISVLINF